MMQLFLNCGYTTQYFWSFTGSSCAPVESLDHRRVHSWLSPLWNGQLGGKILEGRSAVKSEAKLISTQLNWSFRSVTNICYAMITAMPNEPWPPRGSRTHVAIFRDIQSIKLWLVRYHTQDQKNSRFNLSPDPRSANSRNLISIRDHP